MLSKHLVNGFLLSGLVVLMQSNLPCLATNDQAKGNVEKQNENSDLTGEVKRKSTIRQLWAKYQRLGTAAFKQNNLDISLQMFAQAVQEAELLNFDQVNLALSLDSLAIVYHFLGKSQDSFQAEKKALEIRSRFGEGNREARLANLIRIGDLCIEMGDNAGAKTYLQQALSLAELSPTDDATRTKIMDSLLSVSVETHDQSGVKTYLSQLLLHDRGRSADENSASHLEQYARILWQEGQLSEASQCLSQALSIRNACQSPDNPSIIALKRNLVRADLMLGITAEPEQDIVKVLSYDRAHLAPDSSDYLFDLLSLAELKLCQGETGPARQLCEEQLNSQKEARDLDTLDMADACTLLGRICATQDQWYEAKKLSNQACSIRRSLGLPEALSVYDYETLARVASHQGQVQEAESNFQKALAIRLERFSDDKAALAKIKEELQSARDQIAKVRDENHLSARVMPRPE